MVAATKRPLARGRAMLETMKGWVFVVLIASAAGCSGLLAIDDVAYEPRLASPDAGEGGAPDAVSDMATGADASGTMVVVGQPLTKRWNCCGRRAARCSSQAVARARGWSTAAAPAGAPERGLP